jgi:hypothetical protein
MELFAPGQLDERGFSTNVPVGWICAVVAASPCYFAQRGVLNLPKHCTEMCKRFLKAQLQLKRRFEAARW